jgi:hypothetical protein
MFDDIIDETNAACAERLRSFINDAHDIGFFVGSGLSQPAYPDWWTLVTRFSDHFREAVSHLPTISVPPPNELRDLLPRDLQDIFQRFRECDAHTYVDCVKGIFEAPPSLYSPSLMKIVRTRPKLIGTINFDNSIEAVAEECGVEIDARFFPGIRYVKQASDNVPVVMHLHSKFHEKLYDDPERLILHRAAYKRWYEEGDQPLVQTLAEIFLGYDVIFVGTRLAEPEMESFFKALERYHRSSHGANRARIALVGSQAKLQIANVDQFAGVLREEQSRDTVAAAETGIERVRFFAKGEHYPGLHDVLCSVFGQKTVVPQPKPLWENAI